MKNLNIKTIGYLLKYDMSTYVRTIFLKLLMNMFFLAYMFYRIIFNWYDISSEQLIDQIDGWSMVAVIIILFSAMIITTTIIHDKILNKTNASYYYMLPASMLEKNLVIHITYIIMTIASFILIYIDRIIFALFTNDRYTIADAIDFVDFQISFLPNYALSALVVTLIMLLVFSYISVLIFTTIFRKNGIINGLLLLSASCGVFVWYVIKVTASKYTNSEIFVDPPKVIELWMPALLMLIPTILLFQLFYYRIKERQIK
ncbi:MAG: hypothetical protein Q4F97_02365 [Bacteroidales bacterium]|nr:hypothetical protein [Bacteroidales bacterium]